MSGENDSREIDGYTDDALAKGLAGAAKRAAARRSARATAIALETQVEVSQALQDNRNGALRGPISVNGVDHWWCVCVCRWQGLRVPDPEVARREYDKHPCRIAFHDDAVVDRAIAELAQTAREDGQRTNALTKRAGSTAIPALEQQRSAAEEQALGREAVAEVLGRLENETDAAEQRFALLELDKR